MALNKVMLAVLLISLVCSLSLANDEKQHEACIKGTHEGHAMCKKFCLEMKEEDKKLRADCINDCNYFLIEGVKECVKYEHHH